MKSMTGFGRSQVSENGKFVSVEVRTVNNRHLDINLSVETDPELEHLLKDRVKETIHRGNVDISIESNFLEQETEYVTINTELVDEYLDKSDQVVDEHSSINSSLDIADVLSFPGVLSLHTKPILNDQAERMFLEALDSALNDVVEMREAEGQKLREDLRERINTIRNTLNAIEERFPEALEQYRSRLKDRFEEALTLEENALDEELENEITRYADKCDISEEITRVDSHISQFLEYLEEDEPVGKNLKFLVQEIQREVNTIGAKANDAEISQCSVEIKTQLEKCREQINNIE